MTDSSTYVPFGQCGYLQLIFATTWCISVLNSIENIVNMDNLAFGCPSARARDVQEGTSSYVHSILNLHLYENTLTDLNDFWIH